MTRKEKAQAVLYFVALGALVAAICFASLSLAHAGEPQSAWFWFDLLGFDR